MTLEIFAHPGGADAAARVDTITASARVRANRYARALGLAQAAPLVLVHALGAALTGLSIGGLLLLRQRPGARVLEAQKDVDNPV